MTVTTHDFAARLHQSLAGRRALAKEAVAAVAVHPVHGRQADASEDHAAVF